MFIEMGFMIFWIFIFVTTIMPLGLGFLGVAMILSHRKPTIKKEPAPKIHLKLKNPPAQVQDKIRFMDERNALNFGVEKQEVYKPNDTASSIIQQVHQIPKSFDYITIDGEEPEEPQSIFHTKKFLASGFIAAILMGVLSYFFIFSH